MRIIIDESLSPTWATHLTEAAIPAIHWSLLGNGDAPDTEIMAYAVEHGDAILTHDLDFGINLSSSKAPFPSVIQLRTNDTNIKASGSHVVDAIRSNWIMLTEGILLTIDTRGIPRARITRLPLK